MRLLACLITLLAASTSAASVTEYDELRSARPDGRTVRVEGLTLERDAFRIELRSGVVHLLAPFRGRTFGLVFLGDGAYHLTPATASEQRHLRLVTNDAQLETLGDRFDRLVLFFADRTAEDVLAHGPVSTGAPDPQATRAYEDYLARQQRRIGINLPLRLLADLLNAPDRDDGVFLAPVEGRSHGTVLIAVDPLGLSNLTPRFGSYGGEEVALLSMDERNGGFWYVSSRRDEAVDGRGKAGRPFADAEHYAIDTTIDGREIRGVTTIALTPVEDRVRVLPVHISDSLSLRSAVLETGAGEVALGIIRDELQQGWYERLFSGGVADADAAIVFPEPLARGSAVRVRLEYQGRDILQGRDGSFSVGARTSWYPNLGTFADLATYELTFRFPRRNELIAVGRQVSERTDGNQKVAVWRADVPIRVAGFNYGEFRKSSRTDRDTGMEIDVHTHRDWTRMAGTAMADAMNASRLANIFFGDPPYSRLAVTQQVEWTFGQSWPTLVYLPTLALTTSTQRAMGLGDLVDPRAMPGLQEFVNTVGWHEVAHQWWGHQVGWESYRDQWLSEGFAEFTAALVLEAAEGRRSSDRFWELRRTDILERSRGGVVNGEAGAITQGFRLATPRSPGAASAMLYAKGAYVVHMIRMMMREERTADPDRAFRAMMRDFVGSWAGKSPSTTDFQRVVERHMVPQMDLARTGTLDYFFDQWVHRTHLPRLTATLTATDVGGGRYQLAGTVTQAEVPDDFQTLVPIYLELGDRVERLGAVHITGSTTQQISVEVPLPQRPRRVLINARNDVLSR